VPHKLVGMSIYDLVRDLQMQGHGLLREAYNALYLPIARSGKWSRARSISRTCSTPRSVGWSASSTGHDPRDPDGRRGRHPAVVGDAGADRHEREQRTGSTRYNQGMDANSLNKTATGISIIQNASTQRQELIARHLAEGMKSIFRKMLGLVCRHLDKKEVIRLRGKWVEMDPADWKEHYDMSVSVGLGTGNREQQVGQLTNLLNLDKEIIQLQGGANGPIVTMENVYEKLKRCRGDGLKGIESYYTDPIRTSSQQGRMSKSPIRWLWSKRKPRPRSKRSASRLKPTSRSPASTTKPSC
jgi:hypothetical protein